MKAVNFWKTLFCAALAITAFSACSDDDNDDDGGIPSITVDGKESATLAVKLEGGTTEAVEVVSTGNWVLELSGTETGWCHPSKETGGKGNTSLTFTVDKWEGAASTDERSVTATLTTNGSFEGIPIPKEATIIVKQNSDGSTAVTTNVKEIRGKLTFPDAATEITESMVVTGIVVSDVVGDNINNKSFMIADNTTEPGAGLFIRLKGENTIAKMGNIIQFELKGGSQQSYFGTCQVNFTNATADPTITVLDSNDNTPDPITVEDVSKLAEYQSQYVQVYSQPASDIIGQKYYSDPASTGYANKTFITRTGESFSLSFGSYTTTWAEAIEIPGNSGYIKGCISLNSYLGNISPRNADDLNGMTEPLFEVETTTTEISEITSDGNYTIEKATVVSVSAKSFVIGDGTGYICVYKTTDQAVAVGNLVTVSGAVADYSKGMEGKTALQFDPAAEVIKETGTGTITVPAPEVVPGSGIDALVPLKYITVTGTLAQSGNYYNINFADYTGEQTGSLLDAPASLNAAIYDGQDVEVTGWYVYTNTSKFFNVIADKIELVSTDPVVKFTSTPSAFAAENPVAQTVDYVTLNVSGNPTFEISEGADYFEIGTVTATTVEVKAKGNNTNTSALSGKLVAKVNGNILATINLEQNGALSSDAAIITLDINGIVSGKSGTIELGKSNYGSQDVAVESTWYTWDTSSIGFAGARITQGNGSEGTYNNSVLQVQGSTDGVAKQGFIFNTASLGEIISVEVVCQNSKASSGPAYHMYFGTEKNPSTNEAAPTAEGVGADALWSFTDTFDVSGKGYSYFKLYNNSTYALYVKSIEIIYKK
ncbi:MAG: hypothetical protein LUF83_04635 [Alistipes sp.]|nr:hypothetical protein [Alistipes sp.]